MCVLDPPAVHTDGDVVVLLVFSHETDHVQDGIKRRRDVVIGPVYVMELRYPPGFLREDTRLRIARNALAFPRADLHFHTPPPESGWSSPSWPAPIPGRQTTGVCAQTSSDAIRTKCEKCSAPPPLPAPLHPHMPSSQSTAATVQIYLLTHEILKGPKLTGSPNSGKYRSHFF